MSAPTTALQTDASHLATLVFASAPTLLLDLLAAPSNSAALDFLRFSLSQPDGQYGYANHRVLRDQGVPIASFCLWHDQLPQNFDQSTLRIMHQHFGLQHCIEIVQRNQLLSEHLQPPQPHQVAVGHISVAPAFQRRGNVGHILEYAQQQTRLLGKEMVVVDVEVSNESAIRCYQKYGFLNDSVGHQFVRLCKTV